MTSHFEIPEEPILEAAIWNIFWNAGFTKNLADRHAEEVMLEIKKHFEEHNPCG